MSTTRYNDDFEPLQEKNKRLKSELEDIRAKNRYLETLIKETYHRTKNHLLVIMSALNYRSRFCSSEASDALSEARTMVMSVVTLNDLLSGPDSPELVSAQRYLTELAERVFAVCVKANDGLRLKLEVDGIGLDPSILLPCGMVINELMINAFKHAFKDGDEGTITVFLCCKNTGNVRLGVRDDGRGVSGLSRDSTGFELVKVLSKQLGGTFEVKQDNGTECSIVFEA